MSPSLRRVLALILIVQLIFGVLYAVNTPRWQAPDEPAHYNYVRTLAETGTFPVLQNGDYDQAYLEQIKAAQFPPEMTVDPIRYESHQPPFYYVIAAPIYLMARGLGLDTVLALRLLSVGFGLVLSLTAYRIFRQVFPNDRLLQLAAVGIIATLPMHLAMTAAVNNDTLAELVLAFLVLISLLRVQGQVSNWRFIVFAGVGYGLALLTKTTIYSSALVLVVAELGYQWATNDQRTTNEHRETIRNLPSAIRHSPSAIRHLLSAIRHLLPIFALALVIAVPWFVRNASVYGINDLFGWARHDAIVTGQPTTAEWIARYGFKNVFADFFIITFKSFWAQFGWMGVLVNDRIYVILFVLTAFASFGAALWVVRMIREPSQFATRTRWTWFVLGVMLVLVLAAHFYYNVKFVQPQGRYLFPALIPIAALWAAGVSEWLKPRYTPMMFALLYLLMVGLDYAALFWYIVPQLAR